LTKLDSKIETVRNKNSKNRFVSQHIFAELTSLCPVTRLPDFYTVRLTYEPDRFLPELKSLKLYFLTYRDTEILHEEIANEILDDLVKSINPRWVQIVLKVNNRGGVLTTIARKWSRAKGDELVDSSVLDEQIDSNTFSK
jgi:7-cyano-7-deazaguanine reductase